MVQTKFCYNTFVVLWLVHYWYNFLFYARKTYFITHSCRHSDIIVHNLSLDIISVPALHSFFVPIIKFLYVSLQTMGYNPSIASHNESGRISESMQSPFQLYLGQPLTLTEISPPYSQQQCILHSDYYFLFHCPLILIYLCAVPPFSYFPR